MTDLPATLRRLGFRQGKADKFTWWKGEARVTLSECTGGVYVFAPGKLEKFYLSYETDLALKWIQRNVSRNTTTKESTDGIR